MVPAVCLSATFQAVWRLTGMDPAGALDPLPIVLIAIAWIAVAILWFGIAVRTNRKA
jgi:uncharacterized RDD family membrane protein YckC